VHAPGSRVTRVVGTHISVVAIERWPTNAFAPAACVVGRTRIPVIARIGIVGVHTTAHWIARVGSTHVPVIAVERRAGGTGPALTGLAAVADRVVIARGAVGHCGVHALVCAQVAGIGRTGVLIVATLLAALRVVEGAANSVTGAQSDRGSTSAARPDGCRCCAPGAAAGAYGGDATAQRREIPTRCYRLADRVAARHELLVVRRGRVG